MRTTSPSPYADAIPCEGCGAKIGQGCTFKHFSTGQRIATAYCAVRIRAWRDRRAEPENRAGPITF